MTLDQKISILRANDYSLGDMIDEFKSDKEIVLEAVKYNRRNLRYASDDLKKDEDVLACALKRLYISIDDDNSVIEKFFEEVGVDFEEVKSKVGGMLVCKGYEIPEGSTYEEFFGEGFIPGVVGEDGDLQLDIVDELDGLLRRKEEINWILQHENGNISELEIELDTIEYRMSTLYGRAWAWLQQADIYQRLAVTAVRPAIFDQDTKVPEKFGVSLEELSNSEEVQGDADFLRKLEIFKEKCSPILDDDPFIEGAVEYIDGKPVIRSLQREYYSSNFAKDSIDRTGSIDFKEGRICFDRSPTPLVWRDEPPSIKKDYIDKEIIDPRLGSGKFHDVTEVGTVVADRTLGNVRATVKGMEEAVKGTPTVENQK